MVNQKQISEDVSTVDPVAMHKGTGEEPLLSGSESGTDTDCETESPKKHSKHHHHHHKKKHNKGKDGLSEEEKEEEKEVAVEEEVVVGVSKASSPAKRGEIHKEKLASLGIPSPHAARFVATLLSAQTLHPLSPFFFFFVFLPIFSFCL